MEPAMKRMRAYISIELILIISVILFGMAYLCFGVSEQAPAPIPPDVAIKTPDPSLPPQAKLLSGKWTGRWNSFFGWDSVLYVEKINKNSAQIVLAWGEYNTHRESCHCNPNWVRVKDAKVTCYDDFVKLDFYTPKFRPHWLKQTHTVSGSADETYGETVGSSGRYTFSFKVKQNDPNVMKGEFYSARNSYLSVEMKKVQ